MGTRVGVVVVVVGAFKEGEGGFGGTYFRKKLRTRGFSFCFHFRCATRYGDTTLPKDKVPWCCGATVVLLGKKGLECSQTRHYSMTTFSFGALSSRPSFAFGDGSY